MKRSLEIRVPVSVEDVDNFLSRKVMRRTKARPHDRVDYRIRRKSVDARGRSPVFVFKLDVYINESIIEDRDPLVIPTLSSHRKVLIIGAGPAGYFAALRCLELGVKPVIIERGKDVRSRRRDLRQIQQFHKVNPDSNYCFGEGGAGTYSDGKLYTRANKRGNVDRILRILVYHGASRDILIDAHPHIGSNKLPKIVASIRETIETKGGEIHFGQRVNDFITGNGRILGVRTAGGHEFTGDAVILCTGHSARDIYNLCEKYGIGMDFKPYAVGVRIEHPQPLIDEIQYGRRERHDRLPASAYRLACQAGDRGVFSFCMCPGGLVVPTATAPGELVVNGMSLSRRNSPFANAGTVVSLEANPDPGNWRGGLEFQQRLERHFFDYGDGTQRAPAQRLPDFLEGKLSADLPDTSYIPGIYPAPFKELLPDWVHDSLKEAIIQFDRRMKGYLTTEAQMIGLESRTSSPVRIGRNDHSLMSAELQGLFPSGEGAGYAGGIVSAAMDGERVADQVTEFVKNK